MSTALDELSFEAEGLLDTLCFELERQKTVLLLGPGLASPPREPVAARLATHLATRARLAAGAGLHHTAHQFLVRAKNRRPVLLSEVVRFYEALGAEDDALLDLLAGLPFRTIVTTTQDGALVAALQRAGKQPQVAWYHYQQEGSRLAPDGTVEAPLVYHLFGHPSDADSLVLTDDDLLAFLSAVMRDAPRVPANVLSQVGRHDTSCLFLGFELHSWHMRVLLRALGMDANEGLSLAHDGAGGSGEDDETLFFYRNAYQVEFLEDDLGAFLGHLASRWAARAPEAAAPSAPGVVPAAVQTRGVDAPTFFLSYVREDSALAREVVDSLEARGLQAFLDERSLEAGEDWNDGLNRAISTCDHFLPLLTPAWHERLETVSRREIRRALERQEDMREDLHFIIPVLAGLPASDMPERLGPFNAVLWSEDGAERIAKVARRDAQLRSRR